MGSMSNYAENKCLDHCIDGNAYTMPTGYLALSTADPTEDGSGLAEPSGNNYSRVAIAGAFGTGASARSISNDAIITFPKASGSWGTITHWAIFDASTAGNMLLHGAFLNSKSFTTNQTAKIKVGEIVVSVTASNGMTTYLADKWLDHLLGVASYTAESTFVGLGTDPFSDAGAFTNEVANANAYARVAHSDWPVTGNACENNGIITMPEATGNWGSVDNWFLATSGTYGAGNMLIYGTLNESETVGDQDQITFQDGDLNITAD